MVTDHHDQHLWGFIIYLHPWLQITMTNIRVRIYHLFTSLVTDHHDHHPCEDLSSIYILGYRSPWPPSMWGFIIYLHPWLQITMTTIHVRIYHLFTSLVTDHHDQHLCEDLSSIYILGCLCLYYRSPWPPSVWRFIIYLHPWLSVSFPPVSLFLEPVGTNNGRNVTWIIIYILWF